MQGLAFEAGVERLGGGVVGAVPTAPIDWTTPSRPQAAAAAKSTYLTWQDWTAADLGEDAAEFFRREARVYASPGPDYGGGPSWLRLNIATSTAVLDTMVARMLDALGRH